MNNEKRGVSLRAVAGVRRRDAFAGIVRRGGLFATVAVCLWTAGCGYVVGGAYPPEVHTVAVPVFESEAFRRDIAYQLTEAVQREIQQRTPFRLVTADRADTQLIGKLVSVRKDVLTETRFDDPRELQLTLAVEVTWEDLRNRRILAQRRISVPHEFLQVSSQATFAPETGQSLATATQQAVDRLARQIVDMMEAPW